MQGEMIIIELKNIYSTQSIKAGFNMIMCVWII